jgi:cell division protein ZipA
MDKDVIRIIIFAIGLLMIIGMIGWSYLQHKKREQNDGDGEADGLSEQVHSELGHNESDYEPDLDDFDQADSADIGAEDAIAPEETCAEQPLHEEQPATDTLLQTPPPRRPLIIQFSLVSEREDGFSGTEIFEVLDDVGLEYGNLQIFERLDARRLVDFGVANMVKPGIFPSTNLAAFHCPGLVFFMQPGKLDNPVAVFDDFVRTFHYVAEQLGGEKCDHRREPLTDETIEQLRQSLLAS